MKMPRYYQISLSNRNVLPNRIYHACVLISDNVFTFHKLHISHRKPCSDDKFTWKDFDQEIMLNIVFEVGSFSLFVL